MEPAGLAARTTSSFPVAFEAARIRSARPLSFTEPAPDLGEGLLIDMGGLFADRGRRATPGGVHCVLRRDPGQHPARRALEAIATRPRTPTDRYLLYVQPGAPAAVRALAKNGDERVQRASFNVLRGLLAARLPNEDIIGDLAELDHYNTRVERAKSLRRSGFQGLLTQQDLLAAASWSRLAGPATGCCGRRRTSGWCRGCLITLSRAGGGSVPREGQWAGDLAQDRWRSPLDAPGAPLLSREQLLR